MSSSFQNIQNLWKRIKTRGVISKIAEVGHLILGHSLYSNDFFKTVWNHWKLATIRAKSMPMVLSSREVVGVCRCQKLNIHTHTLSGKKTRTKNIILWWRKLCSKIIFFKKTYFFENVDKIFLKFLIFKIRFSRFF